MLLQNPLAFLLYHLLQASVFEEKNFWNKYFMINIFLKNECGKILSGHNFQLFGIFF